MKARLIIFFCLSMGLTGNAFPQVSDTLMKLVLAHNRSLNVAREVLQVSILEAGSGNTPPDPEVEFGYLFGKPSDMGNRVDFGITQQMDFPTSYLYRSNLKKIRISRAELNYALTRQEVLLQARKLYLEQIHLNQLHSLMIVRLGQAEMIREQAERQLEAGEIGLLEVGQSRLLVASIEGETEEVISRIKNNQLALREITGGIPCECNDTLLPQPVMIIPDSLLMAYRMGPEAMLYHYDLKIKEEQKNLAVSNHLPKLSAGYYSETVTNQSFRGVQLGVSVPLWENINTVRKARSEVIHAEAEMDRYLFRQEKKILQQLNELETLRARANKLEAALESANSLELLATVLQNGEISFSDYFYSSDFYFRNQQQLLRYKRDLLLQEAELMKIYL
jgi:outer membrane protein, heavy metal efflux system